MMEKILCEFCGQELINGKCVVCAIDSHKEVVGGLERMWGWSFAVAVFMAVALFGAGFLFLLADGSWVLVGLAFFVSFINVQVARRAWKNKKNLKVHKK